LVSLFDELRQRKVNLVSLRERIDLSTAAGRMMAQVLASIAEFETELRGERVLAGQAIARKNGKKWGGSLKGVRKKVTQTQIKAIHRRKADGEAVMAIATALKMSRPTIYNVLSESE
jgi:DNA invertase Pin-like site-specific DNA recombinase